MKPTLRLVETFSGTGFQYRGFVQSNCFNVELINTCDLDINAILSYAAIHCGLTNEMVSKCSFYPSIDEMAKELADKNIGYDFKKKKPYEWSKMTTGNKVNELKKIWLATHLSKNVGDICRVDVFPPCDMLTFSFPCQSLSQSGKQEGLKGGTRSGLVYEVVRIISNMKENNTLPSFLLMENVAALVSKKFIKDYEEINQMFDDIGYNVYWKLINSKDCGVPQNRQRVFALYVRKDIDNGTFTFPKPFDNGVRLKDILEPEVEDKYYLSEKIQSRFKITDPEFKKDIIGTTLGEDNSRISTRDHVYNLNGNVGCLTATDYKQPKQILEGNKDFVIRKLTNRECFALQGFTFADCDKAKAIGISDSKLYMIAGNGLTSNVISLISEHIYQNWINKSYISFDEKMGFQGKSLD